MLHLSLLLQASAWFQLPNVGPTIGAILFAGLIILTAAMLVLSRTRWGQAKPLTKCLALSVFAHILLIVFAYGTRMLAPAGDADSADEFRVSLVLESDTDGENDILQPGDVENTDLPRTDPVTAPERVDNPVAELNPEQPLLTPDPPGAEIVAAEQDPVDEPQVEIPAEDSGQPFVNQDPVQDPEPEEIPLQPVDEQTADDGSESEPDSLTPEPLVAEQSVPDQPLEPAISDIVEPDERGIPTRLTSVQRIDRQPTALIETTGTSDQPRRQADGGQMPAIYQQRFLDQRVEIGRRSGLSDESEAAVQAALAWLARNQSADGRWDADRLESGREARVYGHARNGAGTDADTGITALSVLALMAAGNTHYRGEYRNNVQRGLEFLLGSQDSRGSLAGNARLYARMYCHAMALLAASEAYALTGDERIRPFLDRAVEFSLACQDRQSGGWRYQPGDPGDMSQFGWQVMALTSAHKAGIPIPAQTEAGMKRFLLSCTSGEAAGLASYRPGGRPSVTMTAEALACRGWLGMHSLENSREAATFLVSELPGEGRSNVYYWYYGTLALHRAQSEEWPQWNRALQQALIPAQRRGGELDGSWDPVTVWGPYGGRAYVTAMSALCLEVYYRYLPLEK